MSTNTGAPDLTQPLQAISQAQRQIGDLQLKFLQQAQSLLKQRASQLAQAASSKSAPPELKARAAHYQNLAAALDDQRLAMTQLPKPAAAAFVLHGRILSAAGKPRKDLIVSLTDDKGVANTRVAPVRTDANGFYTVTLRSAEFPDLVAGISQLFVSVSDAKQKEVAKPSQTITYQPGKVAVMPIVAG